MSASDDDEDDEENGDALEAVGEEVFAVEFSDQQHPHHNSSTFGTSPDTPSRIRHYSNPTTPSTSAHHAAAHHRRFSPFHPSTTSGGVGVISHSPARPKVKSVTAKLSASLPTAHGTILGSSPSGIYDPDALATSGSGGSFDNKRCACCNCSK